MSRQPRLPPRVGSALVLALCGIAYFGFHAVRNQLPHGGPVRASFPSFLVLPVLFSAAELTPGVRFNSRRSKLLVLGAVGTVATVWLEGVVPALYSPAVSDWRDVAAMAAGFAAFMAFDTVLVRQGTGQEQPPRTGIGLDTR